MKIVQIANNKLAAVEVKEEKRKREENAALKAKKKQKRQKKLILIFFSFFLITKEGVKQKSPTFENKKICLVGTTTYTTYVTSHTHTYIYIHKHFYVYIYIRNNHFVHFVHFVHSVSSFLSFPPLSFNLLSPSISPKSIPICLNTINTKLRYPLDMPLRKCPRFSL